MEEANCKSSVRSTKGQVDSDQNIPKTDIRVSFKSRRNSDLKEMDDETTQSTRL